ncbi:fimbrial biogenesis outer membrane usher protein [Serratia fonticola]|uniref:fimbria/pilus outer membrane usher protein n=1 Tax=Serratia fonticola TaxID=47917 RepID=UPI001AE9CB3D|nr:fimbria/pilus outer membrane usher protein [Serratia fonticola]MBP1039088.1 fimbrial biogenesis outer membrane usher protein [Serratia fonticola]
MTRYPSFCARPRRPSYHRFSLHAGLLALAGLFASNPAWARDYFDPGFLGVIGDNTQVDLSTFSEPGALEEGHYPVTVSINQHDAGLFTLEFKKNAQGKSVPRLTPTLLETLGVNITQVPGLKNLPVDKPVNDLPTLIPQARVTLDLAQLRLNLSIPQVAMKPGQHNLVDPAQWDEGIHALLANYTLSAGRSHRSSSGITAYNNTLFALLRAGANAGVWRLRSTVTHARTENRGNGNQPGTTTQSTRFSNTYLARDLRDLRSTLLAGESNTGSDVFDSVPFRGVKLHANEQMLPSQLRGYAPVIDGVANDNARVTVRQNGNVVYETWVAPGPFRITDIQQAGLSGNYDVTMTEANGSTRSFIVPYSSLPVMLRPSGWKHELTAGRYDGNLTQGSRRSEFVLGTLIYGLPQGITLYGGSVMAEDYQALSIGNGISLGNIGAFSADVTTSAARFEENRKTGQSYRVRYSKSLMSTGTSVDLTALRYSTRHYFSFSEFNSQGYRLEDGVSPWLQQRRRSSFQTQLSQQFGAWGSLNFRASRDDYWGNERSLTGLSLGYSNSYRAISYGANYSLDRVKSRDGYWPENRQLSLNLSVPFSVFGYSPTLQSMYATASMSRDNTGRVLSQTGVSGSTLTPALSYRASQSLGNRGQAVNSNLNAGWQGSKGSVSAGYSYSTDSQSVNLNASGGGVLHRNGLTLARAMGESVALVSAPGAVGVNVSGGTAVTDARGYAVVPYLTAYGKNSVGLDPATLPEGVDVTQSNVNVYPTQGAVVRAAFTTRMGYQVLMTLRRGADVVPFGATASLAGQPGAEENGSIVGDAGQVYLSGLPESGTLQVSWGDGADRRCQARFDLKATTTTPERPVREIKTDCVTK